MFIKAAKNIKTNDLCVISFPEIAERLQNNSLYRILVYGFSSQLP